jgi:hypothetical protein
MELTTPALVIIGALIEFALLVIYVERKNKK